MDFGGGSQTITLPTIAYAVSSVLSTLPPTPKPKAAWCNLRPRALFALFSSSGRSRPLQTIGHHFRPLQTTFGLIWTLRPLNFDENPRLVLNILLFTVSVLGGTFALQKSPRSSQRAPQSSPNGFPGISWAFLEPLRKRLKSYFGPKGHFWSSWGDFWSLLG